MHADERMVSPAKFILSDRLFEKYVLMSAIIPIVFIAIKRLDVQLISLQASDQIVGAIGLLYPAVKSQYDGMKESVGTADAANLALFYLLLFVTSLASVVYAAVRFLKHRSEIGPPGKLDVLILVIGIPCGLVFVILDQPEQKPTSLTDLYFDRFGIFYLRQWSLLFALSLILTTALICSLQRLVSNRP